MARFLMPMSMLSLLSIGAIFGFFYAWVCSTMWGLDATDPRIAITAMQAMNASVRNPVFFPVFFLTSVILTLTALIAARQYRMRSAALFFASAAIYFAGALLVTAMVNVPLEHLALAEKVRIGTQWSCAACALPGCRQTCVDLRHLPQRAALQPEELLPSRPNSGDGLRQSRNSPISAPTFWRWVYISRCPA